MLDIKKIQEEAAKEFAEERSVEAKKRLKYKLVEIEDAKRIVRNLERELQDLIVDITD